MSSESGSPAQTKTQSKKEAAKAEKLRRKQEEVAAAAAAAAAASLSEVDMLAGNYGDVRIEEIKSKKLGASLSVPNMSSEPESPAQTMEDKTVLISGLGQAITVTRTKLGPRDQATEESAKRTKLGSLTADLADKTVVIRGSAQAIRAVGKKMAFLVLRQYMSTVQCVLTVDEEFVSAQMVKFAHSLSKESSVVIEGIVSIPKEPIKGTTQQVEVKVRKLYCIHRAVSNLPFNIEDAARSEKEFEKAELTGEQLVRVGQDTRLNYRVLDLLTPANQAIFRIQCQVKNAFTQFLLSEDFTEIQTPKLIAGSSEGGSAVFKLDYKGQPACLAQSPQLHKQMAICGGFGRVFEVGPVFRAEDSYTHRHLCQFVGLDAEMEIEEDYFEVIDIVDRLFVALFDHLNANCKKELEAIDRQYPFEPLKYLPKTLTLTFQKGVQMLKDAGVNVDPLGDLNTENERKLGQLVLEEYKTEFYILHRYPLAVRPFYTMPCYDDPTYSNSFDVFIRGEEIISGAQRIHSPELLTSRAEACGIDVKTISTYIDSFRYGVSPHGGFGVGLERVVMLFCALDNIRKTSLFPRDPKRLAP